MGKPDLQEIFTISGYPYSVFLFHNHLNWCPQKNGGQDLSEWILVKIGDILSVDISLSDNSDTDQCCHLNSLKMKKNNSMSHYLLVQYAQKKKNSENWKVNLLQLTHSDVSILNKWHTALRSKLAELTYRPKNILFFVNPYGGKRQAPQIFEEQVKPILQIINVKWTVINTQRKNHATETLISMPEEKLLEYDAVVGVGGDGTICEVASGLLFKNLKGPKPDESHLVPSPLPIGVIPAGSSNALVYSLHGTEDPITSCIHLVLGGNVPLDIGAIHGSSGISRFILGQLSYGHLADTVYYSEKLRWMGPKRYSASGFRKFVGHATYEGSIEMLITKDGNHKLPSVCQQFGGIGCTDCVSEDSIKRVKSCTKEWKRVDGCFLGISGCLISCRTALTPSGLAPFAHISDGYLELILIRKASRLNHLKYLLRTAGDSRRAFALPFVERYRVQEFIFYPSKICGQQQQEGNSLSSALSSTDRLGSSSPIVCPCESSEENGNNNKNHSKWNCDGELYFQPSLRVSVHSNLIRIMARGRPDLKLSYFNQQMISSSSSSSPSTESNVSI